MSVARASPTGHAIGRSFGRLLQWIRSASTAPYEQAVAERVLRDPGPRSRGTVSRVSAPLTDAPKTTQAGPLAAAERSFGTDVLLTVVSKLLYTAGGVVVTIVIARGLGPTGQGLFAVALNLTLMLIQVGSIGLPIANPYFAARDPAAQRLLIGHSLRLAAVLSLVLAAGACGLKVLLPSSLAGLGWTELAVTLATMPIALGGLFLQGVLLGRKAMLAFNLVELSQVAVALLALVVGFAVVDLTLVQVLVIIGLSRVLSFGVALFNLRDALRAPRVRRPGLLGEMLRKGALIYLVALIGFVLIRVDLLLVNSVLGARQAGLYSIAAIIAEGLVLAPLVVGTNLLPRVATSTDATLTALVFRTMFTGFGLLCVASAPGVAIAVPVLFGDRYAGAVQLYFDLLVGVFALGLLNSLTVHYFIRGYPRVLIATWVLALVLDIAANLVLLGPLGSRVAPIASSVAYSGVLLVHVVVFRRELGSWSELCPRPREASHLVADALRGSTAPRG